MAEPGDRRVEAARPRHERVDLAQRQYLGVNIDDPPGQKGEHLTALLVEPKHPRSVLKTRGDEVEKGVNCCRPRRTGRCAVPPIRQAPPTLPASHVGCSGSPSLTSPTAAVSGASRPAGRGGRKISRGKGLPSGSMARLVARSENK